MTERSINLRDDEVRQILAGRKTQLRRPVKPEPPFAVGSWIRDGKSKRHWWAKHMVPVGPTEHLCPFGGSGDRLWVREAWGFREPWEARQFRADNDSANWNVKWRSSTHMPRWASRITLEVTGVRVERVQDITGPDCMREGYDGENGTHLYDARRWFETRWDGIYAKKGFGWYTNPWVWVMDFKVVTL